ncbi:MAG: protein kinase domain-containing protein [Aquidulcibacter sp.]
MDIPGKSVPTRIGRYRILQNPRFADDDDIRPLGRGGTASVFLVEQDLIEEKTIKRALKLFSPTEEVKEKRGNAGETYGERHFIDEVAVISGITHQNIIGIIDAGVHEGAPYFVMDYVDGPNLETLLSKTGEFDLSDKARLDPYLVTRLAQQICQPLAYLHAKRRFHFDIAPKNIFVRTVQGEPYLVVGDLGVSRYIPPIEDISEDRSIFVAGTKAYTPSVLEPYRKTNSAPLQMLAKLAPHWDLYALGKVIQEIIAAWGLDDARELGALKILCARMISDTTMTAAQASVALERLLPAHVLTVGIEELSTDASGNRRYISIPLAPVPTSRRISKMLDHPVLNRLQLVPQLLLYRSVTPGGVHTAFENLLGSYGMALRCVTKLLADPRFRESFSVKEHEEMLVSVLLSRIDKLPLDRILRLVKPDEHGDRRKRLMGVLDEARHGSLSLKDLIESNFRSADLSSIVDVLSGDRTDLKPYQIFIRSLIESSISARAMDYLQRDSLHTGISPGSGIDTANLIESLRWSQTDNKIGIRRMGVFSAEHMLSARYWMFARLYWNSSNRAVAAMLRHVVSEILASQNITAEYLSKEFSGKDEAGALQALSNHWSKTGGYGKPSSTIIEMLSRPRPIPYRQLLDKFSRNWGSSTEEGRARMKKLENFNAQDLEKLREDFLKQSSFSKKDPSIVLFDYPSEGALKFGEDVLVEVRRDEERPLSEVSDIISTLPNAFNDTCVRLRVFHDPNLSREESVLLEGEVTEFLEEQFGRV